MGLIGVTLVCALFCIYFLLMKRFVSTHLQIHSRVEILSGPMEVIPARTNLHFPNFAGVSQIHWATKLENQLRKADIQISVKEYLVRWFALFGCFSLSGFLLGSWLGSVLCAGLIVGLTLLYLKVRSEQRLRRFNDGLQDMLTVVSNAMRAGHSFAQALHTVCEDLHGPIQLEMQRIEQQTQVGLSMEEALLRASERIGSEDFALIVTAIGIQRQVGGNLSDVLDKISGTIRERIRLQREMKTLTAQGRMSASIFMMMPLAIGVILYLVNPAYMGVMFQSPLGLVMCAFAVFSQLVGYIFIRKIIQVS